MAIETVYDPLRRKEVALTPEERVRQWFIGVLRDSLGVPQHQMMSEVEMKYAGASWRADLLVFGKGGVRKAIVECKRPEVNLAPAVLEQALRYNMVLDVRYLIITNGNSTYAFRKSADGSGWEQLRALPSYTEMNNNE